MDDIGKDNQTMNKKKFTLIINGKDREYPLVKTIRDMRLLESILMNSMDIDTLIVVDNSGNIYTDYKKEG